MENSAFRQTALPKILFEAENLHNKVIIVFGKNIVIRRLSTIHSFNVRRNTRELAGKMKSPRLGQAIQVMEYVAQQCPYTWRSK